MRKSAHASAALTTNGTSGLPQEGRGGDESNRKNCGEEKCTGSGLHYAEKTEKSNKKQQKLPGSGPGQKRGVEPQKRRRQLDTLRDVNHRQEGLNRNRQVGCRQNWALVRPSSPGEEISTVKKPPSKMKNHPAAPKKGRQ